MIPLLTSSSVRRIAITGVGLVTPLGLTAEATWQGVVSGRRAVDWLPPWASSRAGAVRDFGAAVNWPVTEPRRMTAFALRAAQEAIGQAQLTQQSLAPAACVVGTSKIDLRQYDLWVEVYTAGEATADAAVLFPSQSGAVIAGQLGLTGPVCCPVAACATGLVSLIQAAELIRSGEVPLAVAGSTDSSLHAGLLASYRRLGVLAKPGDDPSRACRPFDCDRTGFAVGEGAGMLVLEDWEHARRRGATILAEWIGGIIGGDCTGLTRIDSSGAPLANLLQRLFRRYQRQPADIAAISVHGTATKLNDSAEGAALQSVFGEVPVPVPAFGIKGAIGHLMGAAGAVETAVSVLSLSQNVWPATVNHQRPDPETTCLQHSHETGLFLPGSTVLKLSLGFGGTLAAAMLARVESH